MSRAPRVHNLHRNHNERSPARWLFLDTETLPDFDGQDEIHHFRLAVAELVERRGPSRKRPRATWWAMTEAAEVADCIESACGPGESLYACAHGLTFDLAVTRLPILLLERGWRLGEHALTSPTPWCRFAKGRRRLAVVDSASWLPVGEARLGEDVAITKPPLPAWDAPEAEWWHRCAVDVEILRVAMLELLDWWDRERLGHWSLTGPGSGWNAYRHRLSNGPVVIDPEPVRREAERLAVCAGRMEAFRVGDLGAGAYAVVDFEHAFATVMTACSLPRRLLEPVRRLEVDDPRIGSTFVGVMADALVSTQTPRYPLRTSRGIVHPVGTFVTRLCSPELVEARARGELLALGAGWVYALSSHMSDFGAWCIRIVEGDDPGAPAVARRAVKAWTRTVPGRWAGRTSRVVLSMEQPVPGWRVEVGVHHPGGAPGAVMDMGGRRYWLAQDVDLDDCFPAVLAWIQSIVRVRLNRMVDAAGEAVVLCNTDGMIVDWRGVDWQPAELEPLTWPLRPRHKGFHRFLRVLSPQHWESDSERQLSGVPSSATPIGGDRYVFTDWPQLRTHLQRGDAGYVRRLHTVDLSAVPVLRWVLEDGRTVPVAATGSLEDGTELLPWSQTPRPRDAGPLRAVQHPLLRPLAAELLEESA